MKFIYRSYPVAIGLGLAVLIGLPAKSTAIPYFARKYKVTCARCHVGFPKLNTFGKNFQLHGYQQPGDKNVGKIVTKEDPNLSIPEQAPIAILIENQTALDKWAGTQSPIMFNSPFVFHIFAADSLAQDIGIFAELATSGGVTDVGKVSLSLNNLMNKPINLQIGNLDTMEHGVTEHDLFTRSGYAVQDITLGGYQLSTQHEGVRLFGTIGSPITPALLHGKTDAPPKDAGTPPDQLPSIHGPRVRLQATKKGKTEGDDEADAADPMDSMKGFLWEVGLYNSNSQGAGNGNGTALDANDVTGRVNAYFNNDSFVGVSIYHGRTLVPVTDPMTTLTTYNPNTYTMGGVDFSLKLGNPFEKTKGVMQKPFEILGSYLTGTATSPNGDGMRTNWNGYFVEGDYVIGQKSMFVIRYDQINSPSMNSLELQHITGNYTYYLRTNFFIGMEYTQDLKNTKNNALGIVFDFAY